MTCMTSRACGDVRYKEAEARSAFTLVLSFGRSRQALDIIRCVKDYNINVKLAATERCWHSSGILSQSHDAAIFLNLRKAMVGYQ